MLVVGVGVLDVVGVVVFFFGWNIMCMVLVLLFLLVIWLVVVL